jgi:glycosyltransferase involved in cell wall biosynthesis
MRILLTADPELPVPPDLYGGVQRLVATLADLLQARGHVVGLVAHPASTCRVSRLYPWRGTDGFDRRTVLSNMGVLWRAQGDFRPDVIHAFSRLFFLGPLLACPVPKVVSYGRQPTRRPVRLAAALAGRSLVFAGCSEHISREGRLGGGRWTVVPNFVELPRFTFRDRVPEDAPLVFLSRIEPIKGAHLAIGIAKAAGRELIIAGNHSEAGEEGRYWREVISPELGRNRIHCVGPVNDAQKNELLGRAAALVVPIQWEEPFGIVFVEALACGTPVIGCPRGALPEIVEDGLHGFHIRTVDEGAAAVARIPQISRAACRALVESRYTAEGVVGEYEDLYREMLEAAG